MSYQVSSAVTSTAVDSVRDAMQIALTRQRFLIVLSDPSNGLVCNDAVRSGMSSVGNKKDIG